MYVSFKMLNIMSRKSIIVIVVLFFVSSCICAISDKRLCGDPTCSEPVSYAKTQIQYVGNDARILSFRANVEAVVFSKSAGSRSDLWGVEINGERGYAPMAFLREYKVLKKSLDHVVSTDEGVSIQKNEELDPTSDNSKVPTMTLSDDNSIFQLPNPSGREDITEAVTSTETLKSYEVVDGTTIYVNTDLPKVSLEIKATTTDSTVEPSLQSQSDLKSGDFDTAPQPIYSNDEKEESEGSTGEKLYNYIFSNFMPEEASGESNIDSTAPSKVDMDQDSKEDSLPVDSVPANQNILIESTESSNIPHNSKHAFQPESTTIHGGEHTPANNSTEVDDDDDDEESELEEDDEEDEEDEDFVESVEVKTDSDQRNIHSNNQASLEPNHSSPVPDDFKPDSDPAETIPNTEHGPSIQSSTLEISLSDMIMEDEHKSLEDEVSIASEMLTNNSPTDTSTESVQQEVQVDVLESESISEINLKASENERSGIQLNGNSDSSNHTNVLNILPDEMQVEDLRDGTVAETVDKSVNEHVHLLNKTDHPVDHTNTMENAFFDHVEEPSPIENNVRETSGFVADKSVTTKNLEMKPETTEYKSVSVDSKSSTDENPYIVNHSANVVEVTYDTTETNPVVVEDLEFFEDESVLTTSSPSDFSSNSITYNEDSPVGNAEISVEDTRGQSSDVAGEWFLSSFVRSLFGSSSPSNAVEDIDNAMKTDSGASDTEDSARNSAWSSVHSYTKQVEDVPSNHQPETSPSCLAQSGINPDCDKVLLTGSVPRLTSGHEAVLQQIIPKEGSNGDLQMDAWDYGGCFGSLSYLGIITALSAVVVILGHWYIEKVRCDSTFIKRINELERALLYSELESKNLKIDLEETQQRTVGAKESEAVSHLQEQLKTSQETVISLEEKTSALEEKNASLQSSLDAATDAGLELNRMLSELLTANKGSESLIGSVNDLQQQLNSQQTTINNMKGVLTTKEAESESLRNNITTLQGTINSLQRELNQTTETLNEVLVEKATQENQFRCIKEEMDVKLKAMSENESELLKDISNLRSNIFQMESVSCTQDMELVLLQQYIKNLTENVNHEENQNLIDIFNVAKANTLSEQLLKEKSKLVEELQGEKDARQLLEAHVNVVTNEVETLRKAFEQSEKEKNEAITKHAVLADYFKDKESQLHKELGYRDALYTKTKGDATSVHEEVKSLQGQLENYKSQIDTLKKEITDQERGLKSQILAFEKRSHENWLAARQAERKLQEAKLEAGQLRNRLTMMEKPSQNEKPAVMANDREPLEPSMGNSGSPQLYPVEMSDLNPFVARVQPVASSPMNPAEEPTYRTRSNHASPALPRPLPTSRAMPPRKSPANPPEVSFTVDDARDPGGLLNPSAPFDPYYGRPIQDRNNPDLYHLIPLVPYLQGSSPLILPPPPVLPNDRRPPPLGRMSSPPVDRPSPPSLRHYMESPARIRSSPLEHITPPDRACGRGSASPPRHHRSRRRPSVDSASCTSPFGQPLSQERGRRRSPTPRSMYDHSEHSPSPEHRRPYRRRSRYSDSSPDSGPESSHYARRYDYSPESSFRGRSRTPSPTSFRPISREPSNNQGSNRSSNQSYESDESNRRSGRP